MDEVIIQDCATCRLGRAVRVTEGGRDLLLFSELMPAHAPLPWVRRDRVLLDHVDQDQFEICILQDPTGKARLADDAIHTGAIGVIKDIPPSTTDEPRSLDIELQCDECQIIRITAKVVGIDREVVIQLNSNPPTLFPDDCMGHEQEATLTGRLGIDLPDEAEAPADAQTVAFKVVSNHYAVLGVDHDADEVAIKRAWASLVRQHSPDKDPEGNRRLSEAKSVLLDPRARADYDAELLFGHEIADLFAGAHEAMVEEDFESAAHAFKEILALHPESLDARNQLALTYAYQENYSEAVRQFERLTKSAPDSALYASNLGHVYRSWGEEDESKFTLAELWFERATHLESFNSAHHLSLARLYRRQRRFLESEQAIEAAISADGKFDTDDVDALMELTWVFLFAGQKHRIAGVAERVSAVLPDDPEARSYASFLFLRTAGDLVQNHNAYQDADYFVKAARRISPDLGELEDAANVIQRGAKIDREADAMREDRSIQPIAMPVLLAAIAHSRLGYEVDENFMKDLVNAAGTWTISELRSAAASCRYKYPVAYASVEDMVEKTINLGTYGARPLVSSGSGGGCAVIALFAMLLAVLATVLLTAI